MSENNSTTHTVKVQIDPMTALFYAGVNTGSKVMDAWRGEFEKANVDLATRSRVYWFYVGLIAASEHGVTPDSAAETFLAGASTRAPADNFQLPDGFPDLTDEEQNRLDDLVREVSNLKASQTNNDGEDAQVKYLLDNDWTMQQVTQALGVTIQPVQD